MAVLGCLLLQKMQESKSKHTAEYINTRARAVKHEEGGVFLFSPEPNPIMLATILMQMTTASTVSRRRAAAVLRTSLCGAMPACVRYEECLVCVIHNKI